jgi:hypothetical protein
VVVKIGLEIEKAGRMLAGEGIQALSAGGRWRTFAALPLMVSCLPADMKDAAVVVVVTLIGNYQSLPCHAQLCCLTPMILVCV